MGMLILLGVTLVQGIAAGKPKLRSHIGLLLTCTGLFFLALSNRAYLGHHVLYTLTAHVGPLQMLRASDRLFWPVSYVLLISSIAAISKARPGLALILLPIVAVLQYVDGSKIRNDDRASMSDPHEWLFNPDRLRSILVGENRLIVLPVFGCTPGEDMPLMQPLWIGAETQIATNTMYVARSEHAQTCDLKASLLSPPEQGDVVLVQPGFAAVLAQASWSTAFCRQLSGYEICVNNVQKLSGLPRIGASQ